MKNIFSIFIALLCLFFPYHLIAGDFKSGRSVTINTPQHNDLYITAGNVVVNAPVYGDVIVAGGNVTINDSVMGDVLVVGGTVTLNGVVGDDIRCAGGEVSVNRYVAGDLIAAGGNIHIQNNASVADVVISAGEVVMDGISRTSVKVVAGTFTLNGAVRGNADLRGGKIIINGSIGGKASLGASKEIIITPTARIGRSIRYWLPLERPLKIPEGVSNQRPVYDPLLSITHSRWYFLGASTFLGLLWYLGMAFVMIVLLQYLFSRIFSKAGVSVMSKPVRSALWGIAFFLGTPVVAAILLVTIIGVPVGMLLLLIYAISLLLATVVSSVVITNWVASLSGKNWSIWRMSGVALFTFILLKIISFTPFFGSLLMIVITATAFGAILTNIRWKKKLSREQYSASSVGV